MFKIVKVPISIVSSLKCGSLKVVPSLDIGSIFPYSFFFNLKCISKNREIK